MEKENNQYKYVAKIYNYLMRSVDYDHWAQYILSIYDLLEIKGENILELASGNMKLAEKIAVRFPQIIVSDAALEMLRLNDNNLNKICCSMENLPFKIKFDFIFSTFDSLNYLNTGTRLKKFFEEIASVMTPQSFFTFDVSLENNSLKHVKRLNRKGKFGNIKYIQKSDYDKKAQIHWNRFKIKLEDGTIVEEVHKQKIYDFDFYFKVIDDAELYVVHCFETFTYENANENSERAQFIIKKKF